MIGITVQDLRVHIIRPTLKHLNGWSLSAENLLLGTAMMESIIHHQLSFHNHSKLGLYRLDKTKHQQLWHGYLHSHPDLRHHVLSLVSQKNLYRDKNEELNFNLAYATAMTRLFYLRIAEPLPLAEDVEGLANYWKQHYNTEEAEGSVEQFIKVYQENVLGIK